MTDDKKIELDSEAQKLFEQLGGMESWKETRPQLISADRLAQSLLDEQKRFDQIRIALIRMTYLVTRYLADDGFASAASTEAETFKDLIKVLIELAHMRGHLGSVFIRFRGAPADPGLPEKFDYEVVIGNTAVDTLIAPRIVRRNGSAYTKLPEQLLNAFTILSEYGVNNIFIRLPEQDARDTLPLQVSLKILSGFRKSRETGAPIQIKGSQLEQTVPLINDENFYPDPNLTLVAGLNRFSARSMQDLVQKVDVWLRRQKEISTVKKYAGVYNAALDLPKLSARIKKPPVELNNVKWLISEAEEENVSQEKITIAKLAMESAGTSPQKVAKMIKSIYGDDYAKITTPILGERLHLSSDLLYAAERNEQQKEELRKELLGNLQIRLDQVKDQVIDDIQVREAKEGELAPGTQRTPGEVHQQIYNMVSFYKGRSTTRKKMVGMVHRSMTFGPEDYQILAKDFRTTVEHAEDLVRKLKACFDQDGHFRKNSFHDAVDTFQQYEQKIFAFLWHHMKDAILPADRVAFLNALQTLTARMNQPKRAFKVLLEDICSEPESVQFSDNKAVMLANLILHRPDKTLADYEITPEEIVINRHNLDEMVVEYASWRIEKEKEGFLIKFDTIHKKLVEALSLGQTSEKHLPGTILINLERELFIFLALVECDTGKAILRSAVHEYGDPSAQLYHLKESQDLMGGLLQNLRVAMRALGSVGGINDTGLLEHVKTQEENFQRLKKDPKHRSQARRISEWAEEAIKFIKFRS